MFVLLLAKEHGKGADNYVKTQFLFLDTHIDWLERIHKGQ